MFENRTIDIQISPSQGMVSVIHSVVFEDTFGPYQRHVYKIAREGFDPGIIRRRTLEFSHIYLSRNCRTC